MSRLPSIPKRFFQWYCNPRLEEQILGDLEEQFEEDIEKLGLTKARRRFTWNVIRFCRRSIIKPFNRRQKLNSIGMIKNDIKTSLRIMKREKLYSAINILGLSAGFIIAILILFYVRYEQSYESYNPNANKMVRITMDYLDGETLVDQDCETYHVLGPMIKDEFPEVTNFTRAYRFEFGFEIDGQVFKESSVYAVDPTFLEMFGYPLLSGDSRTALTESSQMVLTETAAKKYFGRTDVVGEIIKLSEKSGATIVGVIPDSPGNTHLKFNVLMSYASMKSTLDKRESPWNQNDTFTYLELADAEKYPLFKEHLAQLSDRLRAEDHIPDERIISQKIEDIHLHSHKSYEAEQNGSATLVLFLLSVALLVILIAILNYINLSTAKAMDRAREAGIRKVIGSSVAQLRVRFFIESVLLNLIAAGITLGVVALVFDSFKELAGLPNELNIFEDLGIWLLFGGLVTASTFLSGIFPAFSLGAFQPLEVLKGKFTHSSRCIFMRKVLVTLQFAIAIFLLIQTYTANRQLDYMLSKDLGMDTERVLVLSSPPPEGRKQSIKSFQTSLKQRTAFQNAGLSSSVPGLSTASLASTTNIQLNEETRELRNNFYIYLIDSNFMATMDMEIVYGNGFDAISNFEHPVIVNEEALRIWGISDPESVIYKKSNFWGRENTIVGVVKNFHQLGVKSAHIPMIFIGGINNPDYISVRLSPGNTLEQVSELEEVFDAHFPSSPFEFFFLDQNFDAQYRSDQQFKETFTILSAFAILITCLGLFGLASFTVAKRTKEIGIRKVLGASISQIVTLLTRDFIGLIGISSVVAIPVTYFLVERWLNQYSFRIELGPWLFVLPTLMVLLVALLVVLSKTYQASATDPVESLRDE